MMRIGEKSMIKIQFVTFKSIQCFPLKMLKTKNAGQILLYYSEKEDSD